jgi:hypothetical protein
MKHTLVVVLGVLLVFGFVLACDNGNSPGGPGGGGSGELPGAAKNYLSSNGVPVFDGPAGLSLNNQLSSIGTVDPNMFILLYSNANAEEYEQYVAYVSDTLQSVSWDNEGPETTTEGGGSITYNTWVKTSPSIWIGIAFSPNSYKIGEQTIPANVIRVFIGDSK